jgi:hypothetical protein
MTRQCRHDQSLFERSTGLVPAGEFVTEMTQTLSTARCRSQDRLEYALFNSLSVNELCDAFFAHLDSTDIRNNILRHIRRKGRPNGTNIPHSFLERLLTSFESSKTRSRISLGTALKELRDGLRKSQKRRFFDCQIMSEGALDRKRAYLVAAQVYDLSVEKQLWDSWKLYQDENCMATIVEICAAPSIQQHFKSIWSDENIRFSVRNAALKRVAAHDFESIEFIKAGTPVSFLTACIAAKRSISDREALSIAENTTSLGSLGYAIWCLGELGKRDALRQLADRINVVEAKLPKTINEQIMDSYFAALNPETGTDLS